MIGKNCRLTRANIKKLKGMNFDEVIKLVGSVTSGSALPGYFYDGLAEPVAGKMVEFQAKFHPRKRKRFEGAAEVLRREGLDSCAVPIYRAVSRCADFDLKTFAINLLLESEVLQRLFTNLM